MYFRKFFCVAKVIVILELASCIQPAFICSKFTIETLEQCVKYVQILLYGNLTTVTYGLLYY